MDPAGYARQVERLKQVRTERDTGQGGAGTGSPAHRLPGTENTMPYILDAVRAYATLSEIVGVMKSEFGIYQEPTWI